MVTLFWRGEREVVRGEGERRKKKSSGVDFKAGQPVRERGRGVRSHWGRRSMLERKTLAVAET